MNTFNYYVIHTKDRKERFNNIKHMEEKLGQHIEIFFGINGHEVKETSLGNFDKKLKLKKNFSLKGQIGCYLSHFLLLKEIYDNNYEHEYSVIFEDDFDITTENLNYKINEAINIINIDFDFLFLGIEGFSVGEHYKDNMYYINKKLKTWGFQGYVVKNKNIKRILEHLYNMYYEVDIQIFQAIKKNQLVGLFISPNYVNQNKSLISIIRPKEPIGKLKSNLMAQRNLTPNENLIKRNYKKPQINITNDKKKITYLKNIPVKIKTEKKKKISYTKPPTTYSYMKF